MPKLTGKIKFFNEEKGFGFITEKESGKDVFLHVSKLDGQDVETGDEVTFESKDGPKGKEAFNVTLIQD